MSLIITPKVRSYQTQEDGSTEVTVDFHYYVTNKDDPESETSGIRTEIITFPPIPDVAFTDDPRLYQRSRDPRQNKPM